MAVLVSTDESLYVASMYVSASSYDERTFAFSHENSFVLQDLDKTLTDNDVERVMSKLLSTFQNEYGAVLR